MTYSQIHCFLESAKYKSFTKAASVMFISQPAVSKQVKLFEEQLGLNLFDRTSGGLSLTEQGKIIYDFFSKHLEELDEVIDKAKNIQSRRKNTIKVGCLDGWNADEFFPEFQDLVKKCYPDAQVIMCAKNHVDMIDAVLNSEIDLGISHESAMTLPTGCRSCVMASSNSIFIISAQNPIASKENLTLEDLKDEPFYCVTPANDEKHSHSQHLIKLCAEVGFEPKIIPVSSSSEAYIRMQGRSGVFLTVSWDRACSSNLYRAIVNDSRQNILAVWRDEPNGAIDNKLSNEIMRHYRNRDADFFKRLLNDK